MDEPAPQDQRENTSFLLPPRRRKKRRRHWDAYAAVIASFVGLLALLVSGYTAHLQRQQVRAQVWPHLQLWWSTRNGYKIFADNEGAGPARVTRVRVAVDGRAMRDWDDVARALGYTESLSFGRSTLHTRVLTAGQSYDVLVLDDRSSEAARNFFRDMLEHRAHRFGILVCYCSVLDECWMTRLGQVDEPYGPIEDTRPVETCPIPPEEAFRD